MASNTQNPFILVALVVTALVSSTYMADSRSISDPSSTMSLAFRLKMQGEPSNCWESLLKLQACSGEIVTFFVNGETYLGHDCCQAIRVIGHDCWPNIVESLGFTTEETDILDGYCDDEAVHNSPPPPLPLYSSIKE
ncbi:egg cell-secreted protein 1.2-like [Abrus precatorius]|uniref:Egg cell-secreted protein 1.2-like n=1 Tax=Abrus precatorius TaxID=3816 RepID=A0A8B8KCK3_ABRPR|nr:egg cell-secreted protein 1.2-like [Abrus precatorius]